MNFNLESFTTERLMELLTDKLKKPQTNQMTETIDAIRNELKSREEKAK